MKSPEQVRDYVIQSGEVPDPQVRDHISSLLWEAFNDPDIVGDAVTPDGCRKMSNAIQLIYLAHHWVPENTPKEIITLARKLLGYT